MNVHKKKETRQERNIREFKESFEIFLSSSKDAEEYLKLFGAVRRATINDSGVTYNRIKEIMEESLNKEKE